MTIQDTPRQRNNDGKLESLASPAFSNTYTDFSQEIVLDPIATEVWIQGPGDVEWQPVGDESMSTWTVDNLLDDSIFVTAKKIWKIGVGTTVAKIIVWN